MSNVLVDGALILVPSNTVVATNTTYTPVNVPLPLTPTCAWVIAISALNDGPVYTFTLEWSTTQAGVYTACSTFVLPTVTQPGNVPIGVSGAMFRDQTARWLRLRVTIGG